MKRRRTGSSGQKNSESTTLSSPRGKKRKVRSRRSTRSTEGKSLTPSSVPHSRNTRDLKRNSGPNLNLPPGKLKEQLSQVISQIPRTKSTLTKFKTVQEAEEFETELKKYLPENVGVGIIREKEVNTYEIIYRTKEDKLLEARRIRQFQRAFINRLEVDQDIQEEIKRARQRAYWAKKNKGNKIKKGTSKTTDRRTKK